MISGLLLYAAHRGFGRPRDSRPTWCYWPKISCFIRVVPCLNRASH